LGVLTFFLWIHWDIAVQVEEAAGTGCCCAEVKEQLSRIESLLLTLTTQFNHVPIPTPLLSPSNQTQPESQNFVPSVPLPTYPGVVLLPEESSSTSDVIKKEEQFQQQPEVGQKSVQQPEVVEKSVQQPEAVQKCVQQSVQQRTSPKAAVGSPRSGQQGHTASHGSERLGQQGNNRKRLKAPGWLVSAALTRPDPDLQGQFFMLKVCQYILSMFRSQTFRSQMSAAQYQTMFQNVKM
jgi:hypothetical protein